MGLFGKKPVLVNQQYQAPPDRSRAAGPSMDEALHNSEMRNGNIQARLQQVEADIINFKREMQRAKPGSSTYNMYKRRAIQAMKQKKSLESRAEMNSNATFNLEQVRDAKYMQQDNIAMVQNLQTATNELRAAQQHIDLDHVEDLQDDMQEVLADTAEVQEILGRSYDVDHVDEAELEAELDGLEDDSLYNVSEGPVNTPSYLQPASLETNPTQAPAAPNYAQPNPALRY